MRFLGELGLEVGLLGAAHAGARGIAALRHEPCDDAVEHDAVVETFVGELRDALDVAGREVAPQADHDVAAAVQRQGKVLVGQV